MASERPAPPRALRLVLALLAVLVLVLAAPPAAAQEERAGDASAAPSGVGTIRGQVFDGKTGEPVEGVSVILRIPGGPADEAPRREVTSTGADGAFRFSGVPAGSYDLRFSKSGYQRSTMTSFTVEPGTINRADFPLPPEAPDSAEQVLQLDEFVVEARTVEEAMPELQLRMESDQLLNILSAEDLSRFAASDVAEALERVAGVSVVEGEFAIIRGLEDRYNSTLYNAAVLPSPDPEKQSVQLDLFPSDIVSNLVVSKTFAPESPSNSSGGSVDIVTHAFPDESFYLKLKGGSGWNTNASDRFLEYEDGQPIGTEHDELSDVLESDYGVVLGGRHELLDREMRFKGVYAREVDYSTAEGFQEGRQPSRETESTFGFNPDTGMFENMILEPSDLAEGKLGLTSGRYDLTTSNWQKQLTYYGSLGIDLDPEGNHRIDGSYFYTEKEGETIELKENGYLPGFDYEEAVDLQFSSTGIPTGGLAYEMDPFAGATTIDSSIASTLRSTVNDSLGEGALTVGSFFESESFRRERDLEVYQLNGEHEFDVLPGFSLSWAANHAETTQEDSSRGVKGFVEPSDAFVDRVDDDIADGELELDFPLTPEDIGPCEPVEEGCGFFATDNVTFSRNSVAETQDFLRFDAEYERDLVDWVTLKMTGGVWYEEASRDVRSRFLQSATNAAGESSEYVVPSEACNSGGNPDCPTSLEELGPIVFDPDVGVDTAAQGITMGFPEVTNESYREVFSWHLGSKLTLWDRLDLQGGFRIEDLLIQSTNDPFIEGAGEELGGPTLFPSRYLFFDRLDTPGGPESVPSDFDPSEFVFNDQILGIDVPVDENGLVNFESRDELEALVNGEIDDRELLPTLGVALRPIEGMSLRGAWSRTRARPSFRELGYYVSVEPGTDELTVGNPQLGLSEVESWDGRIEYAWGEFGDLVAVSVFQKEIQNPIEQIVVRDPTNAEFGSSSALYRTFFNNPNTAELWGIEAEARKSFAFVPRALESVGVEEPGLGFLRYLSIGGNYTYIDAEVDRSEIEIDRVDPFFQKPEGEAVEYTQLEESRRLFNQPEWIANADLTFDHPEWGTKATLAVFTISEVLDAAGVASITPTGANRAYVPDVYNSAYHELRFTMSQRWSPEALPGAFTLSGTLKNITDSERGRIYDPQQTEERVEERAYRVGRDWSFSLSYELTF